MKKRLLLSLILSLMVSLGGISYAHKYSKSTVYMEDKATGKMMEVEKNPLDEIEPLNMDEILVLLVGVDADENPKENSFGRTDTMMLLKANFKTGSIDLLSLPRDSRVDIQGIGDKLNHAHAYGGMPLLLETLQKNLGLNIHYYVKVNFQAVKDLVDAMGGIYLDVPLVMDVPQEDVYLEEGYQKLNGKEALMFVRYREGYVDGDIGRVHAQQYFMKEFIKQVLTTKNIVNLPNLITSYYDNIETNIRMGTMIRMVPLATKLSSENMQVHTLPGIDAMIDGLSYWMVDWDQTNEILDAYFQNYEIDNDI